MQPNLLIYLLFVTAESVIGCYRPSQEKNEKRIAGPEITIEDAPFMLQVMSLSDGQWKFQCGAIIIEKDFALTASQCVSKTSEKEDFKLISGSARRESGTHHSIERQLTHPECDGNFNDCIAVVRVSPAFDFDSKTKPIALINKEPAVATKGLAFGWGQRDYSVEDNFQANLDRVDVITDDKIQCTNHYFEADAAINVDNTLLCTTEEKKELCHGDEGGPLIVDGKLAGVITYTGMCGTKSDPTIHLNVAHYVDWIDQAKHRLR